MAGNRVVIRFIGDDSGLRRAAKSAEKTLDEMGPRIQGVGLAMAGMGASSVAAGVVTGAALAGLPLLIGGIGVAFAIQNEKVKKSFTDLGTHIQNSMKSLTAPIQSELIGIAGKLSAAFDKIAPTLGAMFKQVAPLIGVFADGLTRLVTGFIGSNGLQKALDAAGPFVKILADGLAGLGPAIGQFFGNLTQGTGGATTAFKGFFDVVNGLIPVLGSVIGWLAQMLPVLGPLVAAGLAVVGVLKVWTAAQWLLNIAMDANPIGIIILVIVALVAAFVYAWQSSETFRNVVTGVFNSVRNAIGVAVNWIIDRWNDVVGFFRSLPSRIGSALGSIGAFIGNAFKGAMNLAISWVNWGIDKINGLIAGVNAINPFGAIPSIPHVPSFHQGGVVPGVRGTEVMAVLQAGERVVPIGSKGGDGGAMTIHFGGNVDSAYAAAFQKLVRSGQIQLA